LARIIALDVGSKRIGVAVSDELRILATPRGAIVRTALKRDLAAIQDLVAKEEAERVLVGYPIGMAGQVTRQTEQTEKFAKVLANELTVPVQLWDERMTTQAAQAIVGTSREARVDGRRDAVAAAFILQSYLDQSDRPSAF
jgi:putative Holliday junction resolvase